MVARILGSGMLHGSEAVNASVLTFFPGRWRRIRPVQTMFPRCGCWIRPIQGRRCYAVPLHDKAVAMTGGDCLQAHSHGENKHG